MKGRAIIFLFFNRIASVFQLPLYQTAITPGVNAEYEALLRLGYKDNSAVDWKIAFARLAERYMMLQEDFEKVKDDLKKERLMESITAHIEVWETSLLDPDYKFSGRQNFVLYSGLSFDINAYMNVHKERWMWIIENCSDDTDIVKKLNEFIKNNLNGDIDAFCTRIADLFQYPPSSSGDIHMLDEYNKYDVEEVDDIMRDKFNIYDNITLEIVHFFMNYKFD